MVRRYTIHATIAFYRPMRRSVFVLTTFFCLAISPLLSAQTLGFYGGAGISGDHFSFDKSVISHQASITTGPMAIAGLRYHTLQDFDVMLDASIGISKIKVPVPDGYKGNLKYEQLQSLVMLGSGLNIPLEKANLMPFIQIGAGFLDFWSMTVSDNGSQSAVFSTEDHNTDRWVVVCGAGVDYQFKLFLSSGLNLRFVYTPLNIFKEPETVAYASSLQGSEAIRLQGKLLQAQLTYRVNLPLAKWKERYD